MRIPDRRTTNAETRYKAIVIGGSAAVQRLFRKSSRSFLTIFPCRSSWSSTCTRVTTVPLQSIWPKPVSWRLLRRAINSPLSRVTCTSAVELSHALGEGRNGPFSIDQRVHWSRPSIDALFESAAHAWREGLIAVILSGASVDGAEGIGP